MGYDELSTFIDYVASIPSSFLNELEIRGELEKLFAPVPCWSDNLDPLDNQTWVLCFVSDDSAKETRHVEWVSHVDDHRSVTIQYDSWKYATPVDLDLRYTNCKGEGTL
tara:strand:- start:310 stop:636 length:327 start_codon:yes stop_codon:yes gene_type:complete